MASNELTSREPFAFEFFAMGSPCALLLHAEDRGGARRVAEAAIAEVRRIEARYSSYRADSDLSKINRTAKTPASVCLDPETAGLIDHAFEAHRLSGGLFDVTSAPLRQIWSDSAKTVPDDDAIARVLARVGLQKLSWRRPQLAFLAPDMALDFGGVAKEYAADRAAAICRSMGMGHGLVDLGGDLAIVGAHPDGAPWRIGVRDPNDHARVAATLFVADGGVATSGDYERFLEIGGRRYSHVIDPKTGWPVEGLASVTAAAETCLAAGMASTIGLLMGETGPQWLQSFGAAHLTIARSGALGGSIVVRQAPERNCAINCVMP
jgi:FAD:protein FMN transferase